MNKVEELGMAFEIEVAPSEIERLTQFYFIHFPEKLKKLEDAKRSNFERVREFHEVYEHSVGDFENPGWVSDRDMFLRLKLITEEYNELQEAIEHEGINQVAKELTDLLYVVYGTGVAMGLDLDETFRRVHASNMSKLGEDGKPVYNEYGKVMKGENYQPPNLTEVVDGTIARRKNQRAGS